MSEKSHNFGRRQDENQRGQVKDSEAEIELFTSLILMCLYHGLTLFFGIPQFFIHGVHSWVPQDFHQVSYWLSTLLRIWWAELGLAISRVSWKPCWGQASLHCPGAGEKKDKVFWVLEDTKPVISKDCCRAKSKKSLELRIFENIRLTKILRYHHTLLQQVMC